MKLRRFFHVYTIHAISWKIVLRQQRFVSGFAQFIQNGDVLLMVFVCVYIAFERRIYDWDRQSWNASDLGYSRV